MNKKELRVLQQEMRRRQDVFSDPVLYPGDAWKKAVYIFCGTYPASWEDFSSDTFFLTLPASPVPAISLTWRDAARELIKYVTKKEANMTYFDSSVGDMPVRSVVSSVAAAYSVFSFLQEKEKRNNSLLQAVVGKFFPEKKLPLAPPSLSGVSLPEEDVRPAWYTVNYVLQAAAGIYMEASSDGWDMYVALQHTDCVEEKRDIHQEDNAASKK